jgi:hypothetical protein
MSAFRVPRSAFRVSGVANQLHAKYSPKSNAEAGTRNAERDYV